MRRLYALLPGTEGMAPDTNGSPSPSPRAPRLILPSRTSDGQPRSADFRGSSFAAAVSLPFPPGSLKSGSLCDHLVIG